MERLIEEEYSIIAHCDNKAINILNSVIDELMNDKNAKVLLCNLGGDKSHNGIINRIFDAKKIIYKHRIESYQMKSKDIEELETILNQLDKNYIVIIIGGERFLSYKEFDNVFETEFKNIKVNLHKMEDENWTHLAELLGKFSLISKEKINGLVVFINTYESCFGILQSEFKKFNDPEILFLKEHNEVADEIVKIQENIIKSLKFKSFGDILEEIERAKSSIPERIYKYFKSLAYIKYGYRKEAIEIMENNFENLTNREKITLADLKYSSGNCEQSFVILKGVYEEDKLEIGLMQALVRGLENNKSLKDEDKQFWIEEALRIDGSNPVVLECAANHYSSMEDYTESSKKRRILAEILNDPFHSLLARILELLDNLPKKESVAEDYIEQFIIKNPQLTNEARFRLACLFEKEYDSPFYAYNNFKKVSTEVFEEKVYDAAVGRMKILQDINLASRALMKIKPFAREADARKLSDERCNELLKNIPILASKTGGCFIWQSFIRKTYSQKNWKALLMPRLINYLKIWNKLDFISIYHESELDRLSKLQVEKLDKTMNVDNALKTLSNLIYMELGNKEMETIIIGALKFLTKENEVEGSIWARYFASIIFSINGEHQKANDYALTILDFASKEKDKTLNSKYRMLGLMSWGYSQYRLGNQVEGLCCVLAASELGFSISEIGPFIKDGSNIISRFFFDNKEICIKTNNAEINMFYDKMSVFDVSGNISKKIAEGNWNDVYHELKLKIDDYSYKNINWAGDMVNLINACSKIGNIEEAIKLINTYGDEVKKKLEIRKDIRPKILSSWSEMIIMNLEDKNEKQSLIKATNLLEEAIEDIEAKRRVNHKEERAFISESNNDIFKSYLQLLVWKYNFKDMDFNRNEIRGKIEETLNKLCPRSIIEQKYYNKNEFISPEINEIEKTYRKIYQELLIVQQKKGVNEDLYIEKSKRCEELLEILKREHPYYKSLIDYKTIRFNSIKSNLDDGDILYQYVITKFGLVYILFTKNYEEINFSVISPENKERFDVVTKALGIELQNYSSNIEDIIRIADFMSMNIFYPLLRYIKEKEYFNSNLYVISDTTIPYLSPNLIRINNEWLISRMNSISNLIDYAIFNKNEEKAKNEMKNSTIAMTLGQDKVINYAKKYLTKNSQNFNMKISNKSIENLIDDCKTNSYNTLLLIGHGVQDHINSTFSGSIAIQGNKKLVWIDDIKDSFQYLDTVILITCSSGTPFEGQIETNEGIWGSILQKDVSNIIMCKWDVPVKESMELIGMIFEAIKSKDIDIKQALNTAQKEFACRKNHPAVWAGLEYWKN